MKDKLFYFLLFIVSITVFGVMVFSLAAKKGPYLSIFIPAALIYILVFIISFIKKKKEIYYFLLFMLLFFIIVVFFGILFIFTITINMNTPKQMFVELFLWILEMCFFVPFMFSIIVKLYKLSLQTNNILLKTGLKMNYIFFFIITVIILVFNLLNSFYILN